MARCAVVLNVVNYLIAIVPCIRTTIYLRYTDITFANATEGIFSHIFFIPQFLVVAHVHDRAAAAFVKYAALGKNTFGGGSDDAFYFRV